MNCLWPPADSPGYYFINQIAKNPAGSENPVCFGEKGRELTNNYSDKEETSRYNVRPTFYKRRC